MNRTVVTLNAIPVLLFIRLKAIAYASSEHDFSNKVKQLEDSEQWNETSTAVHSWFTDTWLSQHKVYCLPYLQTYHKLCVSLRCGIHWCNTVALVTFPCFNAL